jgi:3-dehydroquinate synthase
MTEGAKKPVVVLCGFMGTGKSAVGRELARLLEVDFVDTDALVEEREGMPVAEIFEKSGEPRFRELEAEVVGALDPRGGAVVSTGGGTIVDPRSFARLQTLGTTVLLEASVEAIVERAERGAGDRPLLVPGDRKRSTEERVTSLLASRRDAYDRCDLRLDTTTRCAAEAAFDVAEMLRARNAGHALVPLRVDTRPIPGRRPTGGNTRLSRVVVGRGVAARLGEWLERLELETSVYFLSPPRVWELAEDRVVPSLDERGISWTSIPVDDGDLHKTLEQAAGLVDRLAAAGAERDGVVVAVGGGVTGDVGGFVASIYMRGLPFVQIPTSLLAQVDASIGGKVGVNHPRAKNLIGSTYQPHLVLTDPELLASLPDEEVANGMAEVVKTAIIGSAGLFQRLSLEAGKSSRRPSAALLDDAIVECARIKGGIVERDPYERDLRRVLNLGHTVGHALESALSYRGLRHGEAVGLGMLAAWRVAIGRGRAEARWLEDTRALLETFGLPTEVPDLDAEGLRASMQLDKKRRSGRLTFVLPREPGRVEIVDDVTDREIVAAATGMKNGKDPR